MMQFGIISIFPDMFQALQSSITGRALASAIVEMTFWDPRHYSESKHRNVDDRPYGGGPGMVMMYQPVHDAIVAAKQHLGDETRVIYLSPQGQPLTQTKVQSLASSEKMILLAGRYEGIDQRLIDSDVDEEISLGDYIVSGGELGAMVLIDAITRLLPGALGDEQSAQQDSFSHGLLDHPHYTRPECIAEQTVPAVLLGGNHDKIAKWRLKQALGQTSLKRPDLLEQLDLSEEQQVLLEEFIVEYNKI